MSFCETCRDEVEYTIHPVRRKATIKEAEVNYRGKEARCVECRNEIYIPSVHDYNLEQINKKHFK